jgi:hypothetical protein
MKFRFNFIDIKKLFIIQKFWCRYLALNVHVYINVFSDKYMYNEIQCYMFFYY